MPDEYEPSWLAGLPEEPEAPEPEIPAAPAKTHYEPFRWS